MYMIIDDNGVLWTSGSANALEEGTTIMGAVQSDKRKDKKLVAEHLGDSWSGDLVLVQEIARTR